VEVEVEVKAEEHRRRGHNDETTTTRPRRKSIGYWEGEERAWGRGKRVVAG
jgi:hypothetical protein